MSPSSLFPAFLLPQEHELIIIGAGPAGASGAINAARHKVDFLVLDKGDPLEKLQGYDQIANYPGLGIVTGKDLASAFRRHLSALKVKSEKDMILKISREEEGYYIYGQERVYRAKAVVLAPGIIYEKKIPGEEDLLGQGVSYCLTCDGLLYAGKRVAVIAENPQGEAFAIRLQQDYQCQVVFYAAYDKVANTSHFQETHHRAICQRLEKTSGGVNLIIEEQGIEGQGGQQASQQVSQGGSKQVGKQVSKQASQEVDGVFIFRQGASPASLLPEIALDKHHVRVDRNMQTNLPGLFCAGDCTGPPYQIGKAVGEGQIAALAAIKYLGQKPPR